MWLRPALECQVGREGPFPLAGEFCDPSSPAQTSPGSGGGHTCPGRRHRDLRVWTPGRAATTAMARPCAWGNRVRVRAGRAVAGRSGARGGCWAPSPLPVSPELSIPVAPVPFALHSRLPSCARLLAGACSGPCPSLQWPGRLHLVGLSLSSSRRHPCLSFLDTAPGELFCPVV